MSPFICLPLVRVPEMFLQQCFYLLDTLGILLPEDLISNGNKEHMTGDVSRQSEWGRHGKRDDYEACEPDLRHRIASQRDTAASYEYPMNKGQGKKVLDNR